MILTKREKILIYIGIIIVFLGIYYNFFLIPQLAQIKDLKLEIGLRQAEYKSIKLLNDSSLNENFKNLENKLKVLNLQFPDEIDIEPFLLNIENILSVSGAKLKNLNFEDFSNTEDTKQQVNNNEKYVKTPVNIVVEGDYNSIFIFIDQLQNLKRLLNIQSFTIEQNNPNNLNLKISIYIYSIKNSGTSGFDLKYPKGKSNPFEPLFKNSSASSHNSLGPENSSASNNSSGVDVNKIIQETLNKTLENITKTPMNSTSP
ncbi:MAG: type 4a pilus biogenesis protein PilO [Thermoanaerobacteraceae bacterium]